MGEYRPVMPPARNGVGRAALLTGVVALVFAFVPFVGEFVALPACALAVVLGLVGAQRADSGVATNRGEAYVGMALGVAAGFVVALVLLATHAG